MSRPSMPEVPAEAARSLQGAIPLSSCPACGKALTPRQRACSGRCRAALSRRRQDRAREARDQELRQLLKAALRMLASQAEQVIEWRAVVSECRSPEGDGSSLGFVDTRFGHLVCAS